MTHFEDHVDRYQRAVAPLGRFEELNPEATRGQCVLALEDAFATAQIHGLFPAHAVDALGVVTPDLTLPEIMMVVEFAALRHLESRVADADHKASYTAGPVKYETEQSAMVLRDLLAGARARLKELLERMRLDESWSEVFVLDWYATKR